MNILFLAHRVPYAPNRGDRVRAFHLLQQLSRVAEIDVAALAHDADEAGHGHELSAVASRVAIARVPRIRNLVRAAVALPTSIPTTHTLLDAPELGSAVDALVAARRPDVVLCFCTGVAPLTFRPSLSTVPVVLDMVDVDSEKWAALASSSSIPKAWVYAREARVMRAFEARAVQRAFATLVVNDRERKDLEERIPAARIVTVENGVDVEGVRPTGPPASEPVVVFCGVMNYEPNVDGVRWLASEVWPAVLRRHPGARLRIVGANPSASIRALADPARGIEVTGTVADVRPYLWSAAVSVAPLKTARGIQNKVLEAVAAGLPTVVTSAVMAGLPRTMAPACAVADSAEAFAQAVNQWLETPADVRRSSAAMADVESLSWSSQLKRLPEILSDAIGSSVSATRR